MAKYRDPYVCNLKLLLIFLVIFGHLLEPHIGADALARGLYQFIYIFHMPLFAFLSGLYFSSPESCLRQSLNAFKWYAIAQLVPLLCGRLGPYSRAVQLFFLPYWHLWYLFSLGSWALIAAGTRTWQTRFAGKRGASGRFPACIFAAAVLISLLAGLIPFLRRGLSLSRTLVFLPYVLLGMFAGKNIRPLADQCRKRLPVLVPLAAVLTFAVLRLVPPEFLWQATPYANGALTGMSTRLLCLPAALAVGALVLALTPRRKLPFSATGAETLWIYLLHAIPVKILWKLNPAGPFFIPLCLVQALALLALGGLLTRPLQKRYILSDPKNQIRPDA